MDHEQLRYDFNFQGGEDNTYLFTTKTGISYKVTFTPTPYLFGDESPFAQNTFELSLLVGFNPTKQQPPFDRLPARWQQFFLIFIRVQTKRLRSISVHRMMVVSYCANDYFIVGLLILTGTIIPE